MKTRIPFLALALLVGSLAAGVHAEARGYMAFKTTPVRLADQAQVIVTGRLLRVDDVQVSGTGIDAARHKRIGEGAWQDGEAGIRREAVIRVSEVLKGAAEVGTEVRVVSIRQLKFDAYDADLREGEAVYFIHARPQDNLNIILMDERGTISAPECGGNIATAADYVRGYLAAGSKGAWLENLMAAIDLKGGRLSVDGAIELGWNHEDYKAAMTAAQRERLAQLVLLSKVGSRERNELITALGRHATPETRESIAGTLFTVMMADANWSTTSLASMALEESGNRTLAINRLHSEWDSASTTAAKMVVIRSLGLIRPKAGFDGVGLRSRTLEIVGGVIDSKTDKALLREALIASRDLRSEDAHVAGLKKLIDERETNGLTDAEVKAAVIALCGARTVVKNPTGPDAVTVLQKDYLTALANSDPLLKQTIDAALVFPYTSLIVGADGLGH